MSTKTKNAKHVNSFTFFFFFKLKHTQKTIKLN